MAMGNYFPTLTAEEAAELIPHGAMVGVSGFTPAGCPEGGAQGPRQAARALHAAGKPFQIRVLSGASTGAACDDELGLAEAVSWRAPYMTSGPLRKLANTGRLDFVDMHLSHVSQMIMEGFLGRVDFAIIEATDITPDGRVYLTTGIGNSPTFLPEGREGDHRAQRLSLAADPRAGRHHRPAPASAPPSDPDPRPARPDRQAVRRGRPGQGGGGRAHQRVGRRTRLHRARRGQPADRRPRLAVPARRDGRGADPAQFLPLQSGVGNVCNAVLGGLAANEGFPQFKVYTEVLQDSMIDLIATGSVIGASTCSLTLTDEKLKFLYEYFDEFADRIVLRPQEISNNPGIARRLGVIATNTAIEVDIYGHANSTHFFGTQIMNGLGGSGDFERNAYLSIFMCPSTAKGGRISTIVPMCSHVDHSEHSVQVIATEQGLADLRGLSPIAAGPADHRRCAHPGLPGLPAPLPGIRTRWGTSATTCGGASSSTSTFQEHGAMLPDLDLAQFELLEPATS